MSDKLDIPDLMALPVVLVNWTDSKGLTGEWEHLEDIEPMPPCECQTVGFLLEENGVYLCVAMSRSKGQAMGRISIPVCSIDSVYRFKGTRAGVEDLTPPPGEVD